MMYGNKVKLSSRLWPFFLGIWEIPALHLVLGVAVSTIESGGERPDIIYFKIVSFVLGLHILASLVSVFSPSKFYCSVTMALYAFFAAQGIAVTVLPLKIPWFTRVADLAPGGLLFAWSLVGLIVCSMAAASLSKPLDKYYAGQAR